MQKKTALFIIVSISMLSVLGMSAIVPVLPHLTKQFNIPSDQLWLVMSSFTFPGIIFAPLGGILADKYGRKIVLICSLLIIIIGCLFCLFVNSYSMLIVARAIQGVGTGALATLSTVLIGDLFGLDERARIMGLSMVCITVSAAAAPIIGGLFASISWKIPFMLSLYALPVLFLCLKLHFPKPGENEELINIPQNSENTNKTEKKQNYLITIFNIIKSPNLLAVFVFSFVTYMITYGPQITYLPIFADHYFQTSSTNIGLFFAVGALMTSFTAMFIHKLQKRYPERALLITGAVLMLLSNIVFFYMPIEIWISSSNVLFGISQGLLSPIIGAKIISSTTAQNRGGVMAVNSTITRISQAFAPLVASLCWSFFGPLGPFILGAAISLALFPLIKLIYKNFN